MNINLDDLHLFVLTVQHGGISAAAKQHSLQRSKVSRRLQELEKALGCQLLIRTTRQIELTENGRLLYQQINQPLSSVAQAAKLLANQQNSLQGVLRIAVPAALITSNMFTLLLESYLEQFPDVLLEVLHCQESVDLKRENVDIQILPDGVKVINEDYVQQSLLRFPSSLVASPSYLASHAAINCFDDLYEHPMMVSRYNMASLPDNLTLRLSSDDLRLIQHMASTSKGIAILPTILVRDALQSGELKLVLAEERLPEVKLTLIYPYKEFLPEKTRALIQLLREAFVDTIAS
ncbi:MULTISPECIES: LysR family transcriptional regulator [unclassified Shewanella]|uniref:LysR family transcriptional regulator n=1 Tax=unclassified Shewanella TaxID=196818 RepID=UPI001BBDDDED|nr:MULTISPECIES: LysR family transcriptional regulator [unclassified Shewanella]GIU05712.1 LysR family transcriptional regulator [Shewanella sp. MBTL60-112-B1]GIU25902.1 LysR family transcriptional regulator [Shewanella sp. MBTL60-112-B2]